MSLPRTIRHLALGRAAYEWTLTLQRSLHSKRCLNEVPNTVMTVEHDPVFTIGRSGHRENLLASDDRLRQEGLHVVDVERGGDITYHGPGQLVVYPILDLRDFGKDVHHFIWSLEEAVIRCLHAWGIDGCRRDGYPGVWVDQAKIASVGVYIKSWVTYHGLAFNINANPAHWRMIRPCGLPVSAVSAAELTSRALSMASARNQVLRELACLWDADIAETSQGEMI